MITKRTLKMVPVLTLMWVLAIMFPLSSAEASVAGATKTVTWITSLAPGHTAAHNADDVTWPQTLDTQDTPGCGVVLQTDVYKYGENYKPGVDALIAHGTLNKPGSADWTDSAFIISWTFTVEEPCPTETPTPTPDPTPTPTPTTSCGPNAEVQCPTPTPTDPVCGQVDQPACPATSTPTPTPTVTPSSTPSMTTQPSSTPPTPKSTPPPSLPFTGAPTGWLLVLGCTLITLGGIGIGVSVRRHHSS